MNIDYLYSKVVDATKLGLLIFLTTVSVSKSTLAAEYEITLLPTLGGTANFGRAINQGGQVVGQSSLAGENQTQSFLWDPAEGVNNIHGLGSHSQANGLNLFGEVVGDWGNSAYHDSAFIWDAVNGSKSLDSIDGRYTYANDINNAGFIVGNSMTASGIYHAVVWSKDGQIIDELEAFETNDPNLESLGYAINLSGQVVGGSFFSSAINQYHAFLWDPSIEMMRDLGTLGGLGSVAYHLNDSGTVVGIAMNSDEQSRAFIWKDSNICSNLEANSMCDLGTLGGITSNARSVNALDQVVGFADTENNESHAFIWDQVNQMRDLNNLIEPDSGWVLTWAESINDLGQITGRGTINGQTRAFLLTLKEIDVIALLEGLEGKISDLPADSFKNGNSSQLINAFSNKIQAVISTIEVAKIEEDIQLRNELYSEAIDKLSNDIQKKIDGCSGGNANNDWIIDHPDCANKIDLFDLISDMISAIDDLISSE